MIKLKSILSEAPSTEPKPTILKIDMVALHHAIAADLLAGVKYAKAKGREIDIVLTPEVRSALGRYADVLDGQIKMWLKK